MRQRFEFQGFGRGYEGEDAGKEAADGIIKSRKQTFSSQNHVFKSRFFQLLPL